MDEGKSHLFFGSLEVQEKKRQEAGASAVRFFCERCEEFVGASDARTTVSLQVAGVSDAIQAGIRAGNINISANGMRVFVSAVYAYAVPFNMLSHSQPMMHCSIHLDDGSIEQQPIVDC